MDWQRLERLRALFLEGDKTRDYWTGEADLEAYDATFARRIAWKWSAVFRELAGRKLKCVPAEVIDWGCGSGAAVRELVASGFLGAATPTYRCWDRSPLARNFAARKLREDHGVAAEALTSLGDVDLSEGAPRRLLLISHVLNELDKNSLASLLSLARASTYVLWVEPGSKAESRRLSELRDSLRGAFDVLAPCTHQQKCPVLLNDNESDWCHQFAPPPTEAFTDPDWAEFSQRIGVDLRSLPYSFLFLLRKDEASHAASAEALPYSRIIGEPRFSKGYARVLSCDGQRGLAELILQKRDDPRTLKRLQKGPKANGGVPLYRWSMSDRDPSKIDGGVHWPTADDKLNEDDPDELS